VDFLEYGFGKLLGIWLFWLLREASKSVFGPEGWKKGFSFRLSPQMHLVCICGLQISDRCYKKIFTRGVARQGDIFRGPTFGKTEPQMDGMHADDRKEGWRIGGKITNPRQRASDCSKRYGKFRPNSQSIPLYLRSSRSSAVGKIQM